MARLQYKGWHNFNTNQALVYYAKRRYTLDILTESLQPLYEVEIIINPISQMRKLRLKTLRDCTLKAVQLEGCQKEI